jgi:hypothetical protein
MYVTVLGIVLTHRARKENNSNASAGDHKR